MHFASGNEFTPVGKDGLAALSPLIVHSRDPEKCPNLLIFAHGLNGHRYKTWGDFPKFLFEDRTDIDVGLYSYASGWQRWSKMDSTTLVVHARELADTIRDSHYRSVVLVGHSMGGLLCKATIKDLIESQTHCSDGSLAVDRVSGLVLMGTPQAGSMRVPQILTPFFTDARALKAHSPLIESLNSVFLDRVCVDPSQFDARKYLIPTYAVLGTSDKWVDAFSGGMNIGRDYKKTVRGSHSEIVKPGNREDKAYKWFREAVSWCFSNHFPPERGAASGNVNSGTETSDTSEAFRVGGLDIRLGKQVLSRPFSIEISQNKDIKINVDLPEGGSQ
ncbi:alpha/beta hydrolase [Streptomyces sp. A2-16]|uniref:esterase/lipase family protein n=1 Tax=Streptomyces sp. A2-16 TaxID=2781734 RepID=UPI001BAF0B10|nr:alpha/beta fold hydrolase [Streptomyces sp. A2-16]QUC63007.1 alpha/beta hydrolase [Streptomyces sp. A2-16]